MQRFRQQIEQQLVRIVILRERVHEFGDVIGPGAQPQVFAQAPMRRGSLRLRDKVKRAPRRDQDIHLGERLDVTRLAAGDAPDTLGEQREFAAITRKHGQQAVGLTHIAPLEHDGRDPV